MSRLSRFPLLRVLASAWPTVCIEFAAHRLTVVSVSSGSTARAVTGHTMEPVPEGVLTPALNAQNVHDRAALSAALGRAIERVGVRARRVGVILPDSVAKVSLVRFEKVPSRTKDVEQLIHWQVRKAAPFRMEDAQVAYTEGARLGDGGREFVVSLARRDIVQAYEDICADVGAHAGLVDLSTFNLINAVLASPGTSTDADWLLVHFERDYSTLAIVRGADLIFFRSRPNDGDEGLADLVHQTVMYHEDRLGGGAIPRVILVGIAGAGQDHAEQIRRSLQDRMGVGIEAIDLRGVVALRDRIGASQELLDGLAPSVGLLLRTSSV